VPVLVSGIILFIEYVRAIDFSIVESCHVSYKSYIENSSGLKYFYNEDLYSITKTINV
jgi:hypothetical protein